MQARGLLRSVTAAIAFGALSLAAHAQTAPVQGKLVSASKQVKGPSGTVYTTPSSGHFVLVQACADNGITLAGRTFGFIGFTDSTTGCISFTPGFPLPQHEPIYFTGGGSHLTSVSIVGVIEP
jgi:hypothetical protein